MSSGQEAGISAKSSEGADLNPASVSEEEKTANKTSKDQVDHPITTSEPDLDQLKPATTKTDQLEPVSSKTDTDSGFKDPATSGTDERDPTSESSDDEEELHLQWEDDETDGHDLESAGKKKDQAELKKGASETNIIEIDENLLLESSDELDKDDVINNDGNLVKDADMPTAEEDIEKLLASDDESMTEAITSSEGDAVTSKNAAGKPIETADTNEFATKETKEDLSIRTNKSNIEISINEEVGNLTAINNIIATSSPNESLSNMTIEGDARMKPDVMLEIPTQEIIDILDDTDISISCTYDNFETDTPVDDFSETPKATDKQNEKADDKTVFNSGDFEVNSKVADKKTVSEDDWTEIERKLENFETSLIENVEETTVPPNKTETLTIESIELTELDIIKPLESDNISFTPVKDEIEIEEQNSDLKHAIGKTVTLTRLIKDKDASESSLENQSTSRSNQNLKVSILKAGTHDITKSTDTQMSVSKAGFAVTEDDIIEKGVEVNSPIPEEQQASESLSKTQEADPEVLESPDIEITDKDELEMDVDPSNTDNAPPTSESTEMETDELPKSSELPKIDVDDKSVDDLLLTKSPPPVEMTESIGTVSKKDVEDLSGQSLKDMDMQRVTEIMPKDATAAQTTEESTKIMLQSDDIELLTESDNIELMTESDNSELMTKSDNIELITKSDNIGLSETPLKSDKVQTVTDSTKIEDVKKSETLKNTDNVQVSFDKISLTPENAQQDEIESVESCITADANTSTNLDNAVKKSPEDTFEQSSRVLSPKQALNPEVEAKSSTTIEVDSTNQDTEKVEKLTDVQPSTSQATVEDIIPSSSKELTSVVPEDSTSKIIDDVLPSTFKKLEKPSCSSVNKDVKKPIEDVLPSTSKGVDISSTSNVKEDLKKAMDNILPSTSKEVHKPSLSTKEDIQPTSLAPDCSDEAAEATDSLGLLAESFRVMDDDEEQEDDEDDDDDYYPEDESSNQMTAEHSEESNPPPSESETPKEKEIDLSTPVEEKGQEEFNFQVEVEKDGVIGEKETDGGGVVCEEAEKMEVDAVAVEENVAESVEENIGVQESEKPKQDIDTVKLSDTSDTEVEPQGSANVSKLKELLTSDTKSPKSPDAAKSSPCKKLSLATPGTDLSIVDLEDSEDDIQEVNKVVTEPPEKLTSLDLQGTLVTIGAEVEVKTVAVGDAADEAKSKETEALVTTTDVSGIPTADSKAGSDDATKPKHKFSLEIFNLDSDEEDTATQPPQPTPEPEAPTEPVPRNKCINLQCASQSNEYMYADAACVAYYDAAKRRRATVCVDCARHVRERAQSLVQGIRDLTPLLELNIGKEPSELVEISDSDSEEEPVEGGQEKKAIGERGAAFIEAELAKTINETWLKFKMDARLTEAQDALDIEMKKLEEETKEIDAMLSECQVATDQLRNELYATFEQERHELNPLVICDTPANKYMCLESALLAEAAAAAAASSSPAEQTRSKRRMSMANAPDSAAKRAAIPLGYTPLENKRPQDTKSSEPIVETSKADDDKDIAVLKVSMEAAPVDLPPPGELTRPPLRADMCVYAMRNTFGSWARAKVMEVQGKAQVAGSTTPFTICRVKLFSRNQQKTKLLPARCLAYPEPADVRMTIGTRVIALFKDPMNVMKREIYYSGIVAEVPNPVNNYRYLVFFDDGYAQYVHHRDTRFVCECSPLVWEEVHPFSREFVRKYLIAYPERPMVRLHAGQSLKTEWNGKWWTSRVIQVDASLVQVHFEEDNRTEWIYRGSTRLAPLYLELQAAERHRARPMPRTKAQPRVNMPYVEYTRSDEQSKSEPPPPPQPQAITAQERESRQRAVAKKSTATPPAPPPAHPDSVTSRVVYYTPKNAVKPYKMSPHTCGSHCKRKDTLALKDLRTYNPLAKPLLSGWERQIVRYNGHKEVMYRAPCGRRLRNIWELHRYLRVTQSDMAVDLFDFTPHTHCLAEFVLNKCLVGKKDLSHGKENVPVPCVNYYDESLPEFCSYNTERTPTAGVPLNLDPEFLCGCDCTDDCEDKSKCACWKMTLEGARTIGLTGQNIGYVYKRLPEPLPSGIYECNSRCKCKQTCLNRVAQHPLQLKLQVFKTLNRGWGIRALNDVPKGSFLCVYAGNLLTDATANMDGLNEGDEYLAELDYIEVVEQMKEGYEEDIPDADKALGKKYAADAEESEMSSSDEEEKPSKNEEEDGDFCPGFIETGGQKFNKRLRKRDRKDKKEKEEAIEKEKEEKEKGEDDCITISDDEEVREPSRFMVDAGMESNEFVSKYKSVRELFGKDEACYIMDAKVQGNIGRYLNHSCMPNVFVQNVFVDTHDPRFPWVAFFALSHIKAGTELTWNYNYDVGSVPGKALYCYCGAPNCRGRLL